VVINGFLAEQDPQVVVLRGLDGQNVSLPRGQIADMKNAGVSLMPEGLLDAFNDQQVRRPLRLPPLDAAPARGEISAACAVGIVTVHLASEQLT